MEFRRNITVNWHNKFNPESCGGVVLCLVFWCLGVDEEEEEGITIILLYVWLERM